MTPVRHAHSRVKRDPRKERARGQIQAGVWIDRNRAVIVRLEAGGCETKVVLSEVDPKRKALGGSRSHSRYGPQDVAKERAAQGRRERQLREFYGRVRGLLAGVDAVLVMGPALTKHHFCQALSRRDLTIAGVQTTGSLTDRQVAARVREFFAEWDHRPHDVDGCG